MTLEDEIESVRREALAQFEMRCLGYTGAGREAATNTKHFVSGTRKEVRRRVSKLRSHAVHADGWIFTDNRMAKDTMPDIVRMRKTLPIGWSP